MSVLSVNFFLFICVKDTHQKCLQQYVGTESFIIGLIVERMSQMLKPKPNLSEGEAPHEDATHEE